MEVAILIALIVLNGVFAMSEIALVTAKKARLQKLIDEGDSAAAAALRLGEDPTRFMSAVQIGITSIGVLNGIVGESALAAPLAQKLEAMHVPAAYAGASATVLVVVLITYTSIVIGELVPKRLGQTHPELLARLMARPIEILAVSTKPFVWLLSASTQGVLKLLDVKERTDSAVTQEEIHAVLAEGTSAGVIESHEHTMVRNVFRLDDRQIGSLMVPRADLTFLDVEAPFEENLARIQHCDYARFPVVKGNLDTLLGVVNARQWLAQALAGQERELCKQPMQAPLYVPETITGMDLLESFRSSDVQMAFVIDEYGHLQGLVTLQDLVEAITGEFQPRDPDNSWALQREDGSWLLDGHIPVPELKDRLELPKVPEEERGRYHTLSGMLMLLSGHIPRQGEVVQWQDWRFEIVDMDGKVIDKVLATPMPATQETRQTEAVSA